MWGQEKIDRLLQAVENLSSPDWVSLAVMVITALGVIVAIASIIIQQNAESQKTAVEILFKMDDNFRYSESMLGARKAAATALLAGDLSKTRDSRALYDVLGFFELLGMLAKKRGWYRGKSAIDPEMTWSHFYSWAMAYWTYCSTLIAADRAKDPTMWEDYAALMQTLRRIERRRSGKDEDPTAVQALAAEVMAMEASL